LAACAALPCAQVVLVAVMVTHVPLDIGGTKGSLGMVQNIGLTTDKGF